MSKRPASYDIDEHTFEEKERAQEGESIQYEGKHMENRKIYKINKAGKEAARDSGKVDLKIKAPLDNNEQKEMPKLDIKLPQNPFKLSLFDQSQGVGLFTNTLFNSSANADKKDNAQKQPAKTNPPASSSLFGTTTPSTGALFSGTTSLFGNTTGGSLFGTNTGSLFSGNNSSSILFSGSINAFGGTSIFPNKIPSGPSPAEPAEQEGDSAELEKGQEMVVDPSKSEMKYDYGSQEVVRKIAVAKYKKDKGNLVESVEAIIKFDAEKKLHYLIVRLAATKNIIFTGLLLPHKTAISRKDENLDVLAFALNDKKDLEAHRIKMQIKGLDNELKEFCEQIQKIVEGKASE